MLSSSRHSRYFYFFLVAILALHLFSFAIQLKSQIVVAPTELIKLRLIKESPSELKSTRQIVQSEESEKSEKKEDAFLSDKDRSFDRETKAKTVDLFKKSSKGSSAVAKTRSGPSNSKIKDLKLSDVGIGPQPLSPSQATRSPASVMKEGLENGNPDDIGLSSTNDYVEEVQLGDFTHLNTVEYKYYGFFHRIRQKLEQFWGKSIQEKSQALFRSGRTIASQDYVTSLQVTLNARGEIVAVKILGASGIRELDDAAVESFNQAGPFPNPPKDLLVNGEATIQWGFVVKS